MGLIPPSARGLPQRVAASCPAADEGRRRGRQAPRPRGARNLPHGAETDPPPQVPLARRSADDPDAPVERSQDLQDRPSRYSPKRVPDGGRFHPESTAEHPLHLGTRSFLQAPPAVERVGGDWKGGPARGGGTGWPRQRRPGRRRCTETSSPAGSSSADGGARRLPAPGHRRPLGRAGGGARTGRDTGGTRARAQSDALPAVGATPHVNGPIEFVYPTGPDAQSGDTPPNRAMLTSPLSFGPPHDFDSPAAIRT
jgi:hypothetical protein